MQCDVCKANQYDTEEYENGLYSKINRVAPAFYYIDIASLIRDYFFSNNTFCEHYASEDCMLQDYFARGLQSELIQ